MSPSLDSAQTGPGPPGVGARAGPRSVGRTAPYRDTLEANVQLEDKKNKQKKDPENLIDNKKQNEKEIIETDTFMIPISMFA